MSSKPTITDLRTFVATRVKQALTERPRCFEVEYDHRKVKSKNPWTNREKMAVQRRWGTLYPNGIVTLDSGMMFGNLEQMREHFESQGWYEFTWIGEEQ